MIVRLWHGRVPSGKAAAYRAFLIERAVPDYRMNPGNVNVRVLERNEGAITHFMTLSTWADLPSLRGFAGEDLEAAKYYPEDADFLLEFEPRVTHYHIMGGAPGAGEDAPWTP